MATQEVIILHPAIDARDLGPEHVDVRLFPADGPDSHLGHPYMVTLPVATSEGIGQLNLTHPIRNTDPARLGLGLVSIMTRPRAALALFCMGGTATFLTDHDISTVSVCSPAPVLVYRKALYSDELDAIDLFVSGLESWLSLMRARARGNESGFERALLMIPPFYLYVFGLILAERRLGEIPVDERTQQYWRSYNTIHSALKAAEARPEYPSHLPNFEALLTV